MAYDTTMGFPPENPVQTKLGIRLAVLKILLQVDLTCQCLAPATDYV